MDNPKTEIPCSIFCTHAFVDRNGYWRCGWAIDNKKCPHIYADANRPVSCKQYEERGSRGLQIQNSCVAQCAVLLDDHIKAILEDVKKSVYRGCDEAVSKIR